MKKKSISSVISAIFTAIVMGLIPTIICMATGTPRDPNGDGSIDLADSVFIQQFLVGNKLPWDLTSLDFDQNGVISKFDARMVQLYLLNLYNAPDYNQSDEIEYSDGSTIYYRRHDCLSNMQSSYYEYSLAPAYYSNNIGNDTDVIIGDNDMVLDSDTAVVKLSCGGSGFIIGNHVIATAAHCVYDLDTDYFLNISIDIVSANNTVIQTLYPRYIHIPKNFAQLSSYNKEYDYALIYVTADLSQYGKFDLGMALEEYIDDEGTVTVSGFPQEYPSGYENMPYGLRFKATGNIDPSFQNPRCIFYDADTAGGDSGGPVYIEEQTTAGGSLEKYKTAIAINVAESSYYNYNTGVQITGDLLRFYKNNTELTS